MTSAIVFTIVAILAITFVAALLGAGSGEAWEFAGVGFAFSFNLALIIWVVYIVLHFVIKFW